MDLRRKSHILAAGLFLVIASGLALSQSGSKYDPSPASAPRKARPGLIDFTLEHINPRDIDYGQCFDQARVILLEETLRNGYFWSNVVALVLLGSLFLIVVYQHKVASRRERLGAIVLAQFEESLRHSNAQIDDAIKQNNGFKDALATLRESILRSTSATANPPEHAMEMVTTKPRTAGARAVPPTISKPNASKDPGSATAVQADDQMALFRTDAALIMRVNALEQQLARSEEHQKELRKQLNEASRKVQAEQDKNRALKGA